MPEPLAPELAPTLVPLPVLPLLGGVLGTIGVPLDAGCSFEAGPGGGVGFALATGLAGAAPGGGVTDVPGPGAPVAAGKLPPNSGGVPSSSNSLPGGALQAANATKLARAVGHARARRAEARGLLWSMRLSSSARQRRRALSRGRTERVIRRQGRATRQV